MRQLKYLLAACLIVAVSVTPPTSRAQIEEDPLQLYMMQLLGSPDPVLRRRALREIEAAAHTMTPPSLYLVAARLAEGGDYESALYWSFFAELRLRTDIQLVPNGALVGIPPAQFATMLSEAFEAEMPARVHRVSAERRQHLLSRAIRADQQTPRSYSHTWLTSAHLTPGEGDAAGWPSDRELSRLRSTAEREVRSRLEASLRVETLEDQIVRDIARGAAPDEASAFIPEGFRSRVLVRAAVSLIDAECREVVSIMATPSTARPPAFVIRCRRRGLDGMENLWIDQRDGRLIGTTADPERTMAIDQMALRNGESFLAYRGNDEDVVLVAVDGRIEQIGPPARSRDNGFLQAITPSGRYGVFRAGDVTGVLDLETNQWRWSSVIDANDVARDRSLPLSLSQVGEDATGAPYLLGLRQRNSDRELVLRDLISGQERAVSIPMARSLRVRGVNEALVGLARARPERTTTPDTVRRFANEEEWRSEVARDDARQNDDGRQSLLVRLPDLEVAWTGPESQAPTSTDASCTAVRQGAFPRGFAATARSSQIFLGGAGEDLPRSDRAAANACVFTIDGSRLAISAPPFVYLYEVRDR